MTARVNVLRALCPLGNYPVFDIRVTVVGADYELVLADAVADLLRDYCCQPMHHRLDMSVGGCLPRDFRARVVRMTASGAHRHRRLYATLGVETEDCVYPDKLRETGTYRYVFASLAIAAQLCVDADTGKLPAALADYVQLHKLMLFECGGFELLTARFMSARFDTSNTRVQTPDRHESALDYSRLP